MNIKSIATKNFRNFSDFSIDFSKGFQTIIGYRTPGLVPGSLWQERQGLFYVHKVKKDGFRSVVAHRSPYP